MSHHAVSRLMPRTRFALVWLIILWMLPVATYAPLLDNGWADDDVHYAWETQVHRPSDLTRLVTIDVTKEWWKRHYPLDTSYAYTGGGDYRPVGYLYFAFLRPFFGLSAPAYRVANLLIYSLATFLVLVFVYRLTGHAILAWLTAGLVAVDPSRFEYVAILGFQGGLSLVLYLAAVLAYHTARTTPEAVSRRGAYGLSLLAALAASFDYELAISLPAALLLIEWVGGVCRRQWAFRPWAVVPHGLIAFFYLLMRTVVEGRLYTDEGWRFHVMVQMKSTHPLDLLNTSIHVVSRFLMLFIPNLHILRHRMKVWWFGDLPGQTIFAAHPLMTLAVAGFLLAATAGAVWGLTRPRLWQFLRHDERGSWVMLAVGWSVLTLAPAVLYRSFTWRHLLIAIVGANLLKAMGVCAVAEWCARRWTWDRRWLVSLCVVPLVLYNVSVIVPEVRWHDQVGRMNETLLHDAIREVGEAAMARRPVVAYYLNGGWGGENLAIALQELVQTALGRDDIRIVVPYGIWMRSSAAEDFRFVPQVTVGPKEVLVVNNAEHPERLALLTYDVTAMKAGWRIQPNDLYTLEVLEMDEVRHLPMRFVIRYARPPGTRILFLKFDHGRLIRQEVDSSGRDLAG